MSGQQYRFRIGMVCIFTNKGISGVTGNDGRCCTITRLKPKNEWAQGEPEYVIHFLDSAGGGFGVRECELQPLTSSGEKQ